MSGTNHMEEFDLPDIKQAEPTDEEEQREREQFKLDMQRQEADDEQRWKGIELTECRWDKIEEGPYVGFRLASDARSSDQARAKKCMEERNEYVKQRDRWVEWIVGPIHSKKKSKADRKMLEVERDAIINHGK